MGEMGFVRLPFPKKNIGGQERLFILCISIVKKSQDQFICRIAYSVCSLYSGALINDGNEYPVQTANGKSTRKLNHLAKNTGILEQGVSELSDALGIGKSTVHRLLDTLQYYGYIEKSEETNRYRLGWNYIKVGLSVPA